MIFLIYTSYFLKGNRGLLFLSCSAQILLRLFKSYSTNCHMKGPKNASYHMGQISLKKITNIHQFTDYQVQL